MSKLKKMFEQHREKGRFVPVVPRNVENTLGASPRYNFSHNIKKHTKMKYDIHQEDTEMKEEKKMKGPDPCWKGYEMIGKKMKNGRQVPNCVPVKEDKDNLEYADGEMSIHQLKQIKAHADWILEMLKPDTDMPEWVQAKITLAADYLSTACDYLHVEMNEETIVEDEEMTHKGQKEKVVTVRHKTSGKELDVVDNAVEKYRKLGYEPVHESANPFTRSSETFHSKGKVPEPHSRGMKKEEVDENPMEVKKKPKIVSMNMKESKTASMARGIVMRKLGTMKLLKTPKPAQPKEPEKPTDVKNTLKMTTESVDSPPFTPDKPKKNSGVVVGKRPEGMSVAQHLAKKAIQKQMKGPKMTKESRKKEIVKNAVKKSKEKFQADPVITQTFVKTENS